MTVEVVEGTFCWSDTEFSRGPNLKIVQPCLQEPSQEKNRVFLKRSTSEGLYALHA